LRYILPCVEQLDLAASLLNEKTNIKSRLALILIDNIVELIVHTKCVSIIRWDNNFKRTLGEKYTQKDKNEVLGKGFDPKFKFLFKAGVISEKQRDFALLVHPFRNEAYHLGIIHDDIIFELSCEYFRMACTLFESLRPNTYSLPRIEQLTETAKRHLLSSGDTKANFITKFDFCEISNSLVKMLPIQSSSLGMALSNSATRRAKDIKEMIHYLCGGFNKLTYDEVIYQLQYDHELYKDQPDGAYQLSNQEEINKYMSKRKFLNDHWKPKITGNTLERWERRATEIGHIKDSTVALNKFISLTNDFQQFERNTHDAVMQMDMAINIEIDRMRGK